jgi:hypothetical protein
MSTRYQQRFLYNGGSRRARPPAGFLNRLAEGAASMSSDSIGLPRPDVKRIRSLPGYYASSSGRIYRDTGGGLIRVRLSLRHDGYLQVAGKDMGGHKVSVLAHRAVAEAFLGPCPAGMQVCHWNGDKADNRIDNLRYDTPKANAIDSLRLGATRAGEAAPQAKMNSLQLRVAGRLREYYLCTLREIGEYLRISGRQVGRALRGQQWRSAGVTLEGARLYAMLTRPKGEGQPGAKLDDEKVRRVRAMAAEGLRPREIALDLGVSQTAIRNVLTGKNWTHVP